MHFHPLYLVVGSGCKSWLSVVGLLAMLMVLWETGTSSQQEGAQDDYPCRMLKHTERALTGLLGNAGVFFF